MDDKLTNNTVELKLYCPLRFVISVKDSADRFEVETEDFADYADDINAEIIEDIKSDEITAERGLAVGFDDEELETKILSAFPGVENCGGELYGVITVKSRGELTVEEMGKLAEELSSRISNDWGKSFESSAINIGGGNAYITFLTEQNGDIYLTPESDEFFDRTMGGLT